MIKGINHSIIEVNDTGSDYYERAILIIRPEYASVQRTILEKEARAMLKEMGAPSSFKIKRNTLRLWLLPIAAAAAGALVTALIFII